MSMEHCGVIDNKENKDSLNEKKESVLLFSLREIVIKFHMILSLFLETKFYKRYRQIEFEVIRSYI